MGKAGLAEDPYDLRRFLLAQEADYDRGAGIQLDVEALLDHRLKPGHYEFLTVQPIPPFLPIPSFVTVLPVLPSSCHSSTRAKSV